MNEIKCKLIKIKWEVINDWNIVCNCNKFIGYIRVIVLFFLDIVFKSNRLKSNLFYL